MLCHPASTYVLPIKHNSSAFLGYAGGNQGPTVNLEWRQVHVPATGSETGS